MLNQSQEYCGFMPNFSNIIENILILIEKGDRSHTDLRRCDPSEKLFLEVPEGEDS